MPFVGSIIPASLAGVEQRDASTQRAKERRRAVVRAGSTDRDVDTATISAPAGVDHTTGVRSVKGNEEEESREDRAEHGHYTPQGITQPPPGERPKLDISG